jgi:Tfp pilus assembly protein PilV
VWRAVAAARRRALGPALGADAGITMVEVMISMVVMSISLAMFTVAILQINRSASRTQAISQAQTQLNVAFLRLDKEIRYASAISKEGTTGGDPAVEYLTTNTGSRVCTELRINAGQLQRRTWTQPPPPAVPGPGNETPSSWLPLATNVSSTTPFTFHDADDTENFQRLELDFKAGDTAGGPAAWRQTHVTFTALNTSLITKGDSTECIELR